MLLFFLFYNTSTVSFMYSNTECTLKTVGVKCIHLFTSAAQTTRIVNAFLYSFQTPIQSIVRHPEEICPPYLVIHNYLFLMQRIFLPALSKLHPYPSISPISSCSEIISILDSHNHSLHKNLLLWNGSSALLFHGIFPLVQNIPSQS